MRDTRKKSKVQKYSFVGYAGSGSGLFKNKTTGTLEVLSISKQNLSAKAMQYFGLHDASLPTV